MAQPQTRMTRQRAVILEELRKVKTHPTADELYSIVRERLPRISLGTVYRNLTSWRIPVRYAGLKLPGRPNDSMVISPGISMCAASTADA